MNHDEPGQGGLSALGRRRLGYRDHVLGALGGIAQDRAYGRLMDDEGAGVGAQRIVERNDGQRIEPSPFGGDQPLRGILGVNAQIWSRSRVQSLFRQA